MKLNDAHLCPDCDELFIPEKGFGCPSCTNRFYVPVSAFISPASSLCAGTKVSEKVSDEKPKRRKQ